MITTKETGTQYSELTRAVIDFHYDNGLTIAYVTRALTYSDGEYVDDITDDEISEGYEKVREYMYRIESDPLFFKVQRGELDKQVWLDKVEEIKSTYQPKDATKI